MNTIPSIFNERQINHTVLGGGEKPEKVLMPVTCLILNRSEKQYRDRILENLLHNGFESIISIEAHGKNYNLDSLTKQYPMVKFIVPLEDVTQGDLLNMGISMAQTPYVLVLQDNLCAENVPFSSLLAKKLIEKEQFCVCPRLQSSTLQILPVRFSPTVKKSVFQVESSLAISEGAKTLYPADFAGFYDRERFIKIGGADYTITSAYWQKLDLFFRAWLWGEKVTLETAFTLTYSGNVPSDDQTIDASYLNFYLKNLLPIYKSDHAEIPRSSFFAFHSRSSHGLGESLAMFKEARRWTAENKYRFKLDAASLIEDWGKENETHESV